MRVLVASSGHPLRETGGSETAAYALFRALQRSSGVRAWFVAASEREQDLTPVPGRPEEWLLPTQGFARFWLTQTQPAALEGLASLIRRLDPDVLHLHHVLRFGLEAIAVARTTKPGLRIVLTLHEYASICAHYGAMVRTQDHSLCVAASPGRCHACFPDVPAALFSERRSRILGAFAAVDGFVAPSRFLLDRHVAWGLPLERIMHLPNSTELPAAPPPLRSSQTGSPVRFGYFGQMSRFKGVLELLRAIDQLARDGVRPRLVLNGPAPDLHDQLYADTVGDLLQRHAGHVVNAGPYAAADRQRRIAGIDWIVVPSIWWENAPLVIEEALAHRRPVLCSDIGGMAESVRHGLDGLHFRARDPSSLAAALRRIASSPDLGVRLASTMRTPLSHQASADRHLAFYRLLDARHQNMRVQAG